MWGFLERADVARHAASDIRRHLYDHRASELGDALKHSEQLDARAAELEYRWIAQGSPTREPGLFGLFGRLRLIYRRRG